MGIAYNSSISTDGLMFSLDAANLRSYSGSGVTAIGLINTFVFDLQNGVGFTSDKGGQFVFDGSNDKMVSTNYNLAYNNNSEFTIESVCKFNTNPDSYQTVFIYGENNQNSSLIFAKARSGWNSGVVYGGLYLGHLGTYIYATTTLNGNQIVNLGLAHYTITISKPSSVYVGKIYINGILDNSTNSSLSSYTLPAPSHFGISSGAAFNEPVNGNIAMVRVYNRALSALEVKQNYNALRDRYGI